MYLFKTAAFLVFVFVGLIGTAAAQTTADDFYNRGVERLKAGDRPGAVSEFTKAIELKPDFVRAYFERAVAKLELKDLQGAIDDFTRITQIDPKYPSAYFARGVVLGRLK